MVEVLQTTEFVAWFRGLKDRQARARIDARIARLANGNFGDAKRVGSISELRIDYGPGTGSISRGGEPSW
jgi:putative addiction module killer protein